MNPTFSPFWQIATVEEQISKRKSWIYREISAGRFPAPLKIGKSSVWDSADIENWKAAIRANRPWRPTNTSAAA
jgi:predicted DNA-binding transcriptional regulator AlpA